MSDYSDAKREYDAIVARERAEAAAAAADNLPECQRHAGEYGVICICENLRACRERTLTEASRAIKMQRWSHRSPDAFDERRALRRQEAS